MGFCCEQRTPPVNAQHRWFESCASTLEYFLQPEFDLWPCDYQCLATCLVTCMVHEWLKKNCFGSMNAALCLRILTFARGRLLGVTSGLGGEKSTIWKCLNNQSRSQITWMTGWHLRTNAICGRQLRCRVFFRVSNMV